MRESPEELRLFVVRGVRIGPSAGRPSPDEQERREKNESSNNPFRFVHLSVLAFRYPAEWRPGEATAWHSTSANVRGARNIRLSGSPPGFTEPMQNFQANRNEVLPDRRRTEPKTRSKVLRNGTNRFVRGFRTNVILFLKEDFLRGNCRLDERYNV